MFHFKIEQIRVTIFPLIQPLKQLYWDTRTKNKGEIFNWKRDKGKIFSKSNSCLCKVKFVESVKHLGF